MATKEYIYVPWPISQIVPELENYLEHCIADLESTVPAYYVEVEFWNEQTKNNK